jgi:uncharacterized protein (TIGR03067 family)
VRRGLTLTAALAALEAARAVASVPGPLILAGVHAANRFAEGGAAALGAPTRVAALAEEVLRTMFMSKAKVVLVGVLLAGLTGLVVGAGLSQSAADSSRHRAAPAVARVEDNRAQEARQKSPSPDRPGSDRQSDDRAAMVGTWESSETVTRTVGGKVLPPEVQKVRWVITADKIIRTDGEFIEEEWTFRLDPAKSPRAIDLTSRRLGTISGIYRLERNALRMHFGDAGQRPTEFPGSGGRLLGFPPT